MKHIFVVALFGFLPACGMADNHQSDIASSDAGKQHYLCDDGISDSGYAFHVSLIETPAVEVFSKTKMGRDHIASYALTFVSRVGKFTSYEYLAPDDSLTLTISASDFDENRSARFQQTTKIDSQTINTKCVALAKDSP